jgi:hypothetical protein
MIFSGMRDFYFNIIFLKPVNYVRAGQTTKKLNWCGPTDFSFNKSDSIKQAISPPNVP